MKKLILFLATIAILSGCAYRAKYVIHVIPNGGQFYCDSYEIEGSTIHFKSLVDGSDVTLSGTYIIYERK